MNKIFEVYLTKADAPGNEAYARLDLPAQPWALLDALDKLRLRDGEELYLEIDDYYAFEFLAPYFENRSCSLYELNALALKLSELDRAQSTAFEGLVKIEVSKKQGPISMPKLIDLAYSVDCCHVVPEANNDFELGGFYAGNGFVPAVDGLSDELFEMLDFEKIGRELRCGESGVFTSGGYVVQHSDLNEVYTSLNLVPPEKPEYTIKLILDTYPFEGDENHKLRRVPLELPATDAELDHALTKLDAPSWDEVIITDCDSALPGLKVMTDMFDGIEQLNELAQTLRDLEPDGRLLKFKALMEATACGDLDIAMQLAKRLDEYIFTSSISSPREAAIEEMKVVMDDSTADLLTKYVDLYGYGNAIIQHDNAQLTQYGLLEREDGQPILKMTEEIKQRGMEMM